MVYLWLMHSILASSARAIWVAYLSIAAQSLAGINMPTPIILYPLDMHEIAPIELRVGAWLITALGVYAITTASEEAEAQRFVIFQPLAWGEISLHTLLLRWPPLSLIDVRIPNA